MFDPRSPHQLLANNTSSNTYGVKGFRVWGPKTCKVITSRDVIFDDQSAMMSSRKDGEVGVNAGAQRSSEKVEIQFQPEQVSTETD